MKIWGKCEPFYVMWLCSGTDMHCHSSPSFHTSESLWVVFYGQLSFFHFFSPLPFYLEPPPPLHSTPPPSNPPGKVPELNGEVQLLLTKVNAQLRTKNHLWSLHQGASPPSLLVDLQSSSVLLLTYSLLISFFWTFLQLWAKISYKEENNSYNDKTHPLKSKLLY